MADRMLNEIGSRRRRFASVRPSLAHISLHRGWPDRFPTMSRYLSLTRTHSYSLLFALPLLLLYEAGAIYTARSAGSNLRNGADVLLRTLFAIGGIEGALGVAFLMTLVAAALIILERRRSTIPLRFLPFIGMAAESLAYAMLLGVVVGTATQQILQGFSAVLSVTQLASLSMPEAVVLSLGAGLYEELVFRVLLVGGLYAAFRGSGMTALQGGLVSIVVASVAFSTFHYIGPYGESWEVGSFIFRFIAGLAFSVLFLTRGFGIAAWTHALYDLILVFAFGV